MTATQERKRLPLWAFGLANAPTGFVYGFISTAMGILLASRNVPLARIGTISAIAFSPCFWAWLMSPIVDIRFRKRTYCYALVAIAAIALGSALLLISRLTAFTVALTVACAAASLYTTTVSSIMPDVLAEHEYDTVSGWGNVANLGAAGLFGTLVIVLARTVSLHTTAAVLAIAVVLPAIILLPQFPQSPKPEGTLRRNFGAMAKDLRRVAREGRVWIGLLIFLVPVGGFALTNLFSSMGNDFAANEKIVTGLNGIGVAIACGLGCLLSIPLCKRFRRRTVYLAAGLGAAIVACVMGVLPHTIAVYAVGLLCYNLCQGFNYTAMNALQFELIGPKNALAGTMMALLTASVNVPISTMTFIDSHVHDAHGLRAMFFVDGGSAIATVAVLLLILPLLDRWATRRAKTLPAQ